jgi:hypothetical protein
MGQRRELKFALEGFWAAKRTEQELLDVAASIRPDCCDLMNRESRIVWPMVWSWSY